MSALLRNELLQRQHLLSGCDVVHKSEQNPLACSELSSHRMMDIVQSTPEDERDSSFSAESRRAANGICIAFLKLNKFRWRVGSSSLVGEGSWKLVLRLSHVTDQNFLSCYGDSKVHLLGLGLTYMILRLQVRNLDPELKAFCFKSRLRLHTDLEFTECITLVQS